MTEAAHHSDVFARIRQHRDGHLASLVFPPVTEAQLGKVEEKIGFALPTFLRILFTQVANGGYSLGPGYVTGGVLDGCWCARAGRDLSPIEKQVSRSGWRLHERIVASLQRYPGYGVFSEDLPDRFITIGDWGCGVSIQTDGWTGRVYLAGYGGEIVASDGVYHQLTTLELVAPSLEVWFQRWLDDDLDGISSHGVITEDMVDVSDVPESANVWRCLWRFETPPAEAEFRASIRASERA